MITVNTLDIDWITATTDDKRIFEDWRGRQSGRLVSGKHQNYVGFTDESGLFVGWGKQSKTVDGQRIWYDHFCIKSSGYMSRNYAFLAVTEKVRVTRVDVQITVDTVGYDCVDVLASAGMSARHLGVIDNRKLGEGTIQHGVRKGGDRYTRLYLKKSDEGLMSRIEVELKNRGALDFCSIAKSRGISEAKKWAMRKSINKLNVKGVDEYERVIREFDHICGYTSAKPEKVVKGEQKTLEWLELSVIPCMRRLSNDHSIDMARFERVLLEIVKIKEGLTVIDF